MEESGRAEAAGDRGPAPEDRQLPVELERRVELLQAALAEQQELTDQVVEAAAAREAALAARVRALEAGALEAKKPRKMRALWLENHELQRRLHDATAAAQAAQQPASERERALEKRLAATQAAAAHVAAAAQRAVLRLEQENGELRRQLATQQAAAAAAAVGQALRGGDRATPPAAPPVGWELSQLAAEVEAEAGALEAALQRWEAAEAALQQRLLGNTAPTLTALARAAAMFSGGPAWPADHPLDASPPQPASPRQQEQQPGSQERSTAAAAATVITAPRRVKTKPSPQQAQQARQQQQQQQQAKGAATKLSVAAAAFVPSACQREGAPGGAGMQSPTAVVSDLDHLLPATLF